MFPDRLVVESSLTESDDGYGFDIRIPWYRALPLSCLDIAELTVDGQQVPLTSVEIRLNGQRVPAGALADAETEWWFVTDPARVQVSGQPLTAGSHEVAIRVGLRIPYVLAGDTPIRLEETQTRTMEVQHA
jgi:hypothetical protein